VANRDLGEGTRVAATTGPKIAADARGMSRSGGVGVSGVCIHLGCRLVLDGLALELTCPCHTAAFALTGQLVGHQLKTPPPALPRLAVREIDGDVQIYAP
jgi:cytochrome b6-f complex iron-sulfur subunit